MESANLLVILDKAAFDEPQDKIPPAKILMKTVWMVWLESKPLNTPVTVLPGETEGKGSTEGAAE